MEIVWFATPKTKILIPKTERELQLKLFAVQQTASTDTTIPEQLEGEFLSHQAAFNFILLKANDIEKVVEHKKRLRDQIIIDLSRLQAFRTKETATLRWNYINFEGSTIWVLDSKKHMLVPLPLNWHLAQMLMRHQKTVKPNEQDFVVASWSTEGTKPVSNQAIEYIVKQRAKDAGVANYDHYNPTLFRAYFAAVWHKQRRNLKMLQLFMRHNHIETTMKYLNRIVFWEDLEAEFDRFQRNPTTDRRLNKSELKAILDNPTAKQCLQCPAHPVCRYVGEAMTSEWAEGCRFFPKIVEEFLALKTEEMRKT